MLTAIDSTQQNKQIAREFLRLAGPKNKPREAHAKYMAKAFRHHNPFFGGSGEELLRGMEADAKEHPSKIFDVKHVLADGDFVTVHSHIRMAREDLGFAAVHLFRIQYGKIVELWDVCQPVPADSPNKNGMI